MSYCWLNRVKKLLVKKLLKNAWDKYHNKRRKQKAAEYYNKNADLIKLEARNKHRNLSESEKNKKGNIKEKDTT